MPSFNNIECICLLFSVERWQLIEDFLKNLRFHAAKLISSGLRGGLKLMRLLDNTTGDRVKKTTCRLKQPHKTLKQLKSLVGWQIFAHSLEGPQILDVL